MEGYLESTSAHTNTQISNTTTTVSNLFASSILPREATDTKPYYANVSQDVITDTISEVNWYRTAVVSREPAFCVDGKRDSKFSCDAKSLLYNFTEIGVTKRSTAPLNPHITEVDGSVFYYPNNPTTPNSCDLGEFHMNTQTKPNVANCRQ